LDVYIFMRDRVAALENIVQLSMSYSMTTTPKQKLLGVIW